MPRLPDFTHAEDLGSPMSRLVPTVPSESGTSLVTFSSSRLCSEMTASLAAASVPEHLAREKAILPLTPGPVCH